MNGDEETPSFLRKDASPAFKRKVVTIDPGESIPYREADWRDALVIVEEGSITLEYWEDDPMTFDAGAVVWFTGLQIRTLRNQGTEPVILFSLARRQPPR